MLYAVVYVWLRGFAGFCGVFHDWLYGGLVRVGSGCYVKVFVIKFVCYSFVTVLIWTLIGETHLPQEGVEIKNAGPAGVFFRGVRIFLLINMEINKNIDL